MSLRLRLIVAFFALSVLPLGAVTVFTYASNVKAVRDAAAREADLLAGELTQRMQLLTAQLSERMEHLLSLQAATATDATPTPTQTPIETPTQTAARADAPATPAKPAKPASRVAVTTGAAAVADAASAEAMNASVATALGEAAMFLNNVDFPRGRRTMPGDRQGGPSGLSAAGGRSRGDRGGQGTQGPQGAQGAQGAPGSQSGQGARGVQGGQGAAATGGVAPPPRPPASAGSTQNPDLPKPPDAHPGQPPRSPGAGATPSRGFDPTRGGPPPPGQFGNRGGPGASSITAVTSETPTGGLRVDINAVRQKIYQELVPQGQFEKLTQPERQALQREVNQRVLGIMQGIQLGADELKKKAEDAKRIADEQAKGTPPPVAPTAPVRPVGPVPPPTAPPTATPIPPPAAAPSPAQPAAVASTLKSKSALTGNHLDVRVEKNGEVVQQVNAEINLQNVLSTVFSTTRTDRGEVPFAVDKDATLYAPTDADKQRVQGLMASGLVLKPGSTGTLTNVVGDWIVVTTADPSGSGLRFGIARPVGDSMSALRKAAARNASFGLLFIGLAIAGIVPLSGRLTRNLSRLTEGVGKIAHGDFSARVPVNTHDEIGRLAGAFNKMAADVERHQHSAVEQERIRRELELGRQIQHEMLPRAPMHLGLTEVQGVSVPAREVGGDFFNYFEVGDGQIALLVGDVSGKGVGAALLMANIQASLRTRLSLGRDLSSIANAIDHDIEENSPGPVYATLFVGILDPAVRRLRYVNAGHHPQYVLRPGGGLERMASTGLPVGLFAGRGYKEREVQLNAGDVIFFYTDGCVEAEDAAGAMFGAERLEALLTSSPVENPAEVLRRVEADLKTFRGAVEPFDDETMMAVRVG